jgi:hypothetical protein
VTSRFRQAPAAAETPERPAVQRVEGLKETAMGDNSHRTDPPLTQSQNNAMSDDPRDRHRPTNNRKAAEKSAAEKKPPQDCQDQTATEEFGRAGMGVAPKE